MGLFDFLKRDPGPGHTLDDLAERLKRPLNDLQSIKPAYTRFSIPKRSGGRERIIHAPVPALKDLQRCVLRRLLRRLRVHPAATGFLPGRSTVHNALPHSGHAVVVSMDLEDFFTRTSDNRVLGYFQAIGWNRDAAKLLTRICTCDGGLPQGAPTSPVLSNLVNYRLDARLAGLAAHFGAAYTRYADDLTFSFERDEPRAIHTLIRLTKLVAADHGYRVHHNRKLRIMRRHDRQTVTGLVVNRWPSLPRRTRRWLRAVEHHAATGRQTSLSPQQLAGWQSLRWMVYQQSIPEQA